MSWKSRWAEKTSCNFLPEWQKKCQIFTFLKCKYLVIFLLIYFNYDCFLCRWSQKNWGTSKEETFYRVNMTWGLQNSEQDTGGKTNPVFRPQLWERLHKHTQRHADKTHRSSHSTSSHRVRHGASSHLLFNTTALLSCSFKTTQCPARTMSDARKANQTSPPPPSGAAHAEDCTYSFILINVFLNF